MHIWCMRYEAKHAYFKHLAQVTGNFKNIMKTLSTRHQHYMCLQLAEPSCFLDRMKVTVGKSAFIYLLVLAIHVAYNNYE